MDTALCRRLLLEGGRCAPGVHGFTPTGQVAGSGVIDPTSMIVAPCAPG